MSAFPFFLSSTTTTPTPIPSTPEAAPEAVIIITPAEHKVYHEKCNEYISSGLNSDVTIKFLMEKLISMNCTPPKGFMKCIDCDLTLCWLTSVPQREHLTLEVRLLQFQASTAEACQKGEFRCFHSRCA